MNVSLKTGLVSIALKPGNAVTLQQVRQAILNDAFKPKEARVVVVGDLLSKAGKLQFKVAGTNERFPVAAPTHMKSMPWQKEAGQIVLATGLLAAPAKGTEGGMLQIVSVSPLPKTK